MPLSTVTPLAPNDAASKSKYFEEHHNSLFHSLSFCESRRGMTWADCAIQVTGARFARLPPRHPADMPATRMRVISGGKG